MFRRLRPPDRGVIKAITAGLWESTFPLTGQARAAYVGAQVMDASARHQRSRARWRLATTCETCSGKNLS